MRNEYDFIADVSNRFWTDHKGRKVEISTMSDKWLNNIRKKVNRLKKILILLVIIPLSPIIILLALIIDKLKKYKWYKKFYDLCTKNLKT